MTDFTNTYFPLKIELNYQYSLGQLKPYFDGLCEGIARATKCPSCEAVWFPPRLVCCSTLLESKFIEIAGTGSVVETTMSFDNNGEPIVFALIKMDQANNSALGQLMYQGAKKGDRVRLCGAQKPQVHPAQGARYIQLTE